jgi:hypothetical protein
LRFAAAKLGLWVSELPRLVAKPGAFELEAQFSILTKLLLSRHLSIQAHVPVTASNHITDITIGMPTHVGPIGSTSWAANHSKPTLSRFFPTLFIRT